MDHPPVLVVERIGLQEGDEHEQAPPGSGGQVPQGGHRGGEVLETVGGDEHVRLAVEPLEVADEEVEVGISLACRVHGRGAEVEAAHPGARELGRQHGRAVAHGAAAVEDRPSPGGDLFIQGSRQELDQKIHERTGLLAPPQSVPILRKAPVPVLSRAHRDRDLPTHRLDHFPVTPYLHRCLEWA
jgi:hypothetical protein